MADPFAPSTDPDIPTPTQSGLLKYIPAAKRAPLLAGTLPASVAHGLWMAARQQWDEFHKANTLRRREKQKERQQIDISGEAERVRPQAERASAEQASEAVNELQDRLLAKPEPPPEKKKGVEISKLIEAFSEDDKPMADVPISPPTKRQVLRPSPPYIPDVSSFRESMERMAIIGQLAYRMSLALSPPINKPKLADTKTPSEAPQTQIDNPDSWAHLASSSQIQKAREAFERNQRNESKATRSWAMARFFKDVDRWRSHVVWLGTPLRIWWVLVAVVAGTWAGGVGAMYADQYLIAIGLFIVTFAALAIRAINETRDREKNLLVVILALLFLAAHVVWVMHTHRQIVEKAQTEQLVKSRETVKPSRARLVLDVHRVTLRSGTDLTQLLFALTIKNEGEVGIAIKHWRLSINTSKKGTITLDPVHASSDVIVEEGERQLTLPTYSQDLVDRVDAITRERPAVGMLSFVAQGLNDADIRGACLSLTGTTQDETSFGEPCLRIDVPTEPIHVPGLNEKSVPKKKRRSE
jgi:hypothetical protein